jgi:hypothetical protein
MDKDNMPGRPDGAQRRKLLRGAVSAPVFFTLPVGSALATSSILQCVAKDGVEQPSRVSGAPDTWVRKEAGVYLVKVSGGARVLVWALGSGYYYKSTVSGTVSFQVGDPVVPTQVKEQQGTEYLLVLVSPTTGEFQAIYPAQSVGQGVHASCWNSIRPVANPSKNSVGSNGLYSG